MIRDKIHDEMVQQKVSQVGLVRLVNNLNPNNKLTQPQLSNYLSGKKLLSIYHIESIFKVLGIVLIRIL